MARRNPRPKIIFDIWAKDATGKVVGHSRKCDQLNSDNYGVFLRSFFGQLIASGGSNYAALSNITYRDGTARSGPQLYSGSVTNLFNNTNHNSLVCAAATIYGGNVSELGTGNTAPTRGDHALTTPAAGPVFASVAASSYSAGVVTLSFTITYGSAINPQEAALYMWDSNVASNATGLWLMDHVTFAAPGSALTFTYQWQIALV